jgi:hypothetical protein
MHQGGAVLDIVDFQDDSGEHYSVYISDSLLGAIGKISMKRSMYAETLTLL